MVEDLKQANLSFDKGIHRTPSICSDGELSECVNLVSKNGELMNLQPPTPIFGDTEFQYTLCYIHKTSLYDIYITNDDDSDGDTLRYSVWSKDDNKWLFDEVENEDVVEYLLDSFYHTNLKVISCGNVLAVYSPEMPTEYFLFKGTKYEHVSSAVKCPDIEFGLKGVVRTNLKKIKNNRVSNEIATVYGDYRKTLLYDSYISRTIGPKTDGYDPDTNGTSIKIPFIFEKDQYYRFEISESAYNANMSISVVYDQDRGGESLGILRNGDYVDFYATEQGEGMSPELYLFISSSDSSYNTEGSVRIRIYGLSNVSGLEKQSGYFGNYDDVCALYNKFLTSAMNSNGFVSDFFVRYGLRLVTGDIVAVSSPILIRPNENGPWLYTPTVPGSSKTSTIYCSALVADLYYRLNEEINNDIVESIVIGVSLPVPNYDVSWEAERVNYTKLNQAMQYNRIDGRKTFYTGYSNLAFIRLHSFEDSLENRLVNASTFRIIKEIPIQNVVNSEWTKVELKEGTLTGMAGKVDQSATSGENMIPDSYNGIDSYRANGAFVYNNRLSFYNLFQIYSAGYPLHQMQAYVKGGSNREFNYKVKTVIDNVDVELVYGKTSSDGHLFYNWFFFPNMKATKANIIESIGSLTREYEIPLTSHPFLNGRYFYGDFEDYSLQKDTMPIDAPRTTYTSHEENKYITSAFNQPLYSNAVTGYIGSGEILAVSIATKALSQGQYGQFPLHFFCTDGIWAISIGNDGNYLTTNPVSRDVLSNPNGIAQTDDAIVFATKHGLKILVGSDTRLISTPVHGLNVDEGKFLPSSLGYKADTEQFLTQLQRARIIYDYVGQLLHVYVPVSDVHYVVSLESGEWSKQWLKGMKLRAFVPGYPYTSLQFENKLYQYVNEVEAHALRDGFLLTRPMSLGDPFTRKSVWDFRLLGQRTNKESSRKVSIFGSHDQIHWYQVTSLKGASFKYFRFLVRTHFADIDTLSGMSLMFKEKFGHKLR